jgi:hypothetical protein
MLIPKGVAVDSQYRIYVADSGQNLVHVFDRIGGYLGDIDDINNAMRIPLGIAIGASNRLFVASQQGPRIDIFGLDTYTQMSVSPLSLSFEGVECGTPPVAQTVTITNNGNGTLNWTASSNESWITLSAASGSTSIGSSSLLDINVDLTTGLTAGAYSGIVSITSTATGITDVVIVSLNVSPGC